MDPLTAILNFIESISNFVYYTPKFVQRLPLIICCIWELLSRDSSSPACINDEEGDRVVDEYTGFVVKFIIAMGVITVAAAMINAAGGLKKNTNEEKIALDKDQAVLDNSTNAELEVDSLGGAAVENVSE